MHQVSSAIRKGPSRVQRQRRLLSYLDNTDGPGLEWFWRHRRTIGHERPGRGRDSRQVERIGGQLETVPVSHSFVQQEWLRASCPSGRESGPEHFLVDSRSEGRVSAPPTWIGREHRLDWLGDALSLS